MNQQKLTEGAAVGRWTLRERLGPKWACICTCGSERDVYSSNLKRGLSKSCGCLKAEVTTVRNTTHGQASRDHKSRTYKAWKYMKDRVATDPDYANVTICSEWSSYALFVQSMGEQPEGRTLDRVDNSLGYCKENCRWATPVQQANNKTSNVLLEFQGKTQTMAEWARDVGVAYKTLHNRLSACGWSVEKALTTPTRRWS